MRLSDPTANLRQATAAMRLGDHAASLRHATVGMRLADPTAAMRLPDPTANLRKATVGVRLPDPMAAMRLSDPTASLRKATVGMHLPDPTAAMRLGDHAASLRQATAAMRLGDPTASLRTATAGMRLGDPTAAMRLTDRAALHGRVRDAFAVPKAAADLLAGPYALAKVQSLATVAERFAGPTVAIMPQAFSLPTLMHEYGDLLAGADRSESVALSQDGREAVAELQEAATAHPDIRVAAGALVALVGIFYLVGPEGAVSYAVDVALRVPSVLQPENVGQTIGDCAVLAVIRWAFHAYRAKR